MRKRQRGSYNADMTSVATVRKHTAPPASATEIRKALKITKADISAVKKALSSVGYSKAEPTVSKARKAR